MRYAVVLAFLAIAPALHARLGDSYAEAVKRYGQPIKTPTMEPMDGVKTYRAAYTKDGYFVFECYVARDSGPPKSEYILIKKMKPADKFTAEEFRAIFRANVGDEEIENAKMEDRLLTGLATPYNDTLGWLSWTKDEVTIRRKNFDSLQRRAMEAAAEKAAKKL